MTNKEFREMGHLFVDWMADYLENVAEYPVKAQVTPREIFNQFEDNMPTNGEDMGIIFRDFQEKILKGVTHWQSPNFYAYFPANSSYASVLAEMLTATLGAQGMLWETAPAATELEEKVMEWLKNAMNLPKNWHGVIQDTASSATLCALLSAREKYTDFAINNAGFEGFTDFRVYASSQTHSSIEKGVKIAGFGKENLVYISIKEDFSIDENALINAIEQDLRAGKKPLCVIATVGTTSSTAIDNIRKIGEICQKYGLWYHVDAAYAGSVAILPEFSFMFDGLELADSYVFNPHKWLMVNFDCSAYFVKDKSTLIRTFEILPEYLKTATDNLANGVDTVVVNNYRDWGIPLGRRFRALKLWFVLRNYGLNGLQTKIRNDINLAKWLENEVLQSTDFEILAPVNLNLVCFRYLGKQEKTSEKTSEKITEEKLNKINENILQKLNKEGKIYLTHTKLNGKYTLRMVLGQTNLTHTHVAQAWELIKTASYEL